MKRVVAALLLIAACAPAAPEDPEIARLAARAEGITIVRDSWGIPHIYAATDADAVFGMVYAQAEDDFNRIEVNFMNSMGRLAEAEGEDEIWRDLRMKLFIDPDEMRALYASAEPWLQALMDGWADGLNYYLRTHPDTQPRVLDHFEPWMALTFSEGSIGGDIERVSMGRLEEFYGAPVEAAAEEVADLATLHPDLVEPAGSNGFAIAPSNTANGNALLLINPHTSFYFRHELHMVSDEGLNAYGAVTWGQFFVYQGFNETAGWMHTSTGADAIDEYYYDVDIREDGVYYPYGDEERRMTEKVIAVPYRTSAGMAKREFTTYRSHHGPIVRVDDEGRWIAVKLMEEPLKALTQSYTRTKAANFDEFKQTMELHTNSSNNTVFADAEGNIAYFHANFVPNRSLDYDWTAPVPGMTPDTEWQGLLSVDDSPNAFNPPGGWIQNTNNWPYSVTGDTSPLQSDYPPYVDRFGENARGLHALKVLPGVTDFTLETLRDAAYDSYLIAFEPLIPVLVGAHEAAGASASAEVGEAIELLRNWDLRFGVDSVPTAVAIFWGDEMLRRHAADARAAGEGAFEYITDSLDATDHLDGLQAALDKLSEDFGQWDTPWGEINRFQRLTGDIVQPFDDDAPSIPVGFTSARWGSLAAYGQRTFNDTKRIYGTRGNSFVAVVEFGDRLRALAITAGGLNNDPASPHFNDQAERYATGDLREVYFYREDVDAVAERTYHPGE